MTVETVRPPWDDIEAAWARHRDREEAEDRARQLRMRARYREFLTEYLDTLADMRREL